MQFPVYSRAARVFFSHSNSGMCNEDIPTSALIQNVSTDIYCGNIQGENWRRWYSMEPHAAISGRIGGNYSHSLPQNIADQFFFSISASFFAIWNSRVLSRCCCFESATNACRKFVMLRLLSLTALSYGSR